MDTATFTCHDDPHTTLSVSTRGAVVVLDAIEAGTQYTIDISRTEAYALASFVEWLTESHAPVDECWTAEDIGTLLAPTDDRDEPNSYAYFPEFIKVSSDVYPDESGESVAVVIVELQPLPTLPAIPVTLHANAGTDRAFAAALIRAAVAAV